MKWKSPDWSGPFIGNQGLTTTPDANEMKFAPIPEFLGKAGLW
jgi:hypothetical protein